MCEAAPQYGHTDERLDPQADHALSLFEAGLCANVRTQEGLPLMDGLLDRSSAEAQLTLTTVIAALRRHGGQPMGAGIPGEHVAAVALAVSLHDGLDQVLEEIERALSAVHCL